MGAIEQQAIDILSKLNENNKSVVLDFARFMEQKQLFSEKEARNAAYLDKIQRGTPLRSRCGRAAGRPASKRSLREGIDQCAEGRGFARDIIEA